MLHTMVVFFIIVNRCIKIQSLGLSTDYLEDEDIRLTCRSTIALASVPLHHAEEAYELLENNSPTTLNEFF